MLFKTLKKKKKKKKNDCAYSTTFTSRLNAIETKTNKKKYNMKYHVKVGGLHYLRNEFHVPDIYRSVNYIRSRAK